MKRIPREPERFEVLELFNSLGLRHGFSLGDKESENRFIRTVAQSFSATSKNPIFLYGRRVQAMFGYVVAALGSASLVKEEDAGELYVRDPDVRPLDFLVGLEAGSSFLVEVKIETVAVIQRFFWRRRREFGHVSR
jgi:hypothetical protein